MPLSCPGGRSGCTSSPDRVLALVKGAGDLATGVALALHGAGVTVLMTEIPEPTAVRLAVSFAAAVYDSACVVEGVRAERATAGTWRAVSDRGCIPVVVDPEARILEEISPRVVVDAIMAKRNLGTSRRDGAVVIALGPGFAAGSDVDAVVETLRGPGLGRVIRSGSAAADTGMPGEIGGRAADRVLRAPAEGRLAALRRIGDVVQQGDPLFSVDGNIVVAPFDGCLRGLIHAGALVSAGQKVGDLDPRSDPALARMVSDKSRSMGAAVVAAVIDIGRERGLPALRKR
jgi:xanthine dehydrogenase accessory factor